MKRFLPILIIALAVAGSARAGLAGWLTASACPWKFVQETGGIRIGSPLEKDGRQVLPVEYDATGTFGVTHRPTRLNSGLAVRKIQSNRTGTGQIVIRVITQVIEPDRDTGPMHYADLNDISPGAYKVYYEKAGDPAKLLGTIRVK